MEFLQMMKYKLLVLYISVTQFASGSENDSGEVFSQAKHHRHSKRGIYGHGMDRNEICPKECLCLSEIQVLCNTGNLSEFPTNFSNETQDISITYQNISVVPKYAFKGMKYLRKITLDHNKIKEIQPFAFKGLSNIEEISVRWNPIETIAGFAFAGIRNVSTIYLGYNKIQTISGYAFAGSENIAMLVINDNPIKTVDSFAFAGLKVVKFLLVSSSVRHLHEDAFNGLETVEHLKLDFLNLKTMLPYTFRGLFNCRKLTIDNSDLGNIQPRALSGILGVQEIHIINSKIDKVHENIIYDETQLKTLRLEGNHLLAVPNDFDYMSLMMSEEVTFTGVKNHLPCDCNLLSVLDSFISSHQSNFIFQDNFCVSPLDFNGHTLYSMWSNCRAKGHIEVAPTVITKLFSNSRTRNRERKTGKFHWNKEKIDTAPYYSFTNKTVSSISSRPCVGYSISIIIVTANQILSFM